MKSPAPELQRGWWGNLFNDVLNYQIGSKIWLLYQARKTQDTLNRAITYVNDGLTWLVEDGYIDRANVSGEFSLKGISLTITLYRSQNIVASFTYELWQATRLTNAH